MILLGFVSVILMTALIVIFWKLKVIILPKCDIIPLFFRVHQDKKVVDSFLTDVDYPEDCTFL